MCKRVFTSSNQVWRLYFQNGFHSWFRDANYQTLLCKRFDTKTLITWCVLCWINISSENSWGALIRQELFSFGWILFSPIVFQSCITLLLMRFRFENLEKCRFQNRVWKLVFATFVCSHMRKALLLIVKTAICRQPFLSCVDVTGLITRCKIYSCQTHMKMWLRVILYAGGYCLWFELTEEKWVKHFSKEF